MSQIATNNVAFPTVKETKMTLLRWKTSNWSLELKDCPIAEGIIAPTQESEIEVIIVGGGSEDEEPLSG